jgi:cytochrome P450
VRYVGGLPTTPGDRERLVTDPGLLPTAMEEFVRAYPSVTWRGW